MPTDTRSLEQSLASLNVESRRVAPCKVADAVAAFAADPAVAVHLDRDNASLPDSVTVDPTPVELKDATTGVTPAAFAVADYGSVVLPTTAAGSELVSLHVDRHVAVLDAADVVSDMESAFERFGRDISNRYGSAVLATGPSATADMGALVKGAHGPSEVRVVIVED
ncbi:LUD domain-containing protein [Haloarchaeobius salinus]|uniref:LUD domain-containing protein n=1 Tax=Haloarchaeobius salinus TaxID=1198298 RepID=UPI00210B22BB|nr:LUD domain-containing protein [Haloarchaeobius salinus]